MYVCVCVCVGGGGGGGGGEGEECMWVGEEVHCTTVLMLEGCMPEGYFIHIRGITYICRLEGHSW